MVDIMQYADIYPTSITIEVTEDDIANGTEGENDCCPIALALHRAFPGYGIAVYPYEIILLDEQTHERGGHYSPEQEMIRFVNNFDEGIPVFPDTFTVLRSDIS